MENIGFTQQDLAIRQKWQYGNRQSTAVAAGAATGVAAAAITSLTGGEEEVLKPTKRRLNAEAKSGVDICDIRRSSVDSAAETESTDVPSTAADSSEETSTENSSVCSSPVEETSTCTSTTNSEHCASDDGEGEVEALCSEVSELQPDAFPEFSFEDDPTLLVGTSRASFSATSFDAASNQFAHDDKSQEGSFATSVPFCGAGAFGLQPFGVESGPMTMTAFDLTNDAELSSNCSSSESESDEDSENEDDTEFGAGAVQQQSDDESDSDSDDEDDSDTEEDSSFASKPSFFNIRGKIPLSMVQRQNRRGVVRVRVDAVTEQTDSSQELSPMERESGAAINESQTFAEEVLLSFNCHAESGNSVFAERFFCIANSQAASCKAPRRLPGGLGTSTLDVEFDLVVDSCPTFVGGVSQQSVHVVNLRALRLDSISESEEESMSEEEEGDF
jgi:hypothetical protein